MICDKIYHRLTFASENKEIQKTSIVFVKLIWNHVIKDKKICDIVYHKICCKSEQIIKMSHICWTNIKKQLFSNIRTLVRNYVLYIELLFNIKKLPFSCVQWEIISM